METPSVRTTIYLAAGIGIILSIFSGLELVFTSLSQICSFNGFFSCAAVSQSSYSYFLYLPAWLWGFGGFVVIIGLAAFAERYPYDPRWPWALLVITTLGSLLSFYFLYLELAVIGAFCVVCSSSYVMGFICWFGAMSLVNRTHEKDPGDSEA